MKTCTKHFSPDLILNFISLHVIFFIKPKNSNYIGFYECFFYIESYFIFLYNFNKNKSHVN